MNVMQQFLLLVFITTTIVVFFIEDVINVILRRMEMLKNKNERLEYILKEENWIKVAQIKEFNLTIKQLKETKFIRLYFNMYNNWEGTHEVCIGTYLLTENNNLDTIYSYSVNQIVDKLKEVENDK